MGDSRRKIATLYDTIAGSNTFQKAPPCNIRHSWRMCNKPVRGERSFLRHYVHTGA